MLMREVDEAVRQDQATDFAKKFGLPIGIAVLAGLLAFGGYLLWDNRNEAELQRQSEQLIVAMDQLESGNPDNADAELTALSEGSGGAAALARMMQAGIAFQSGETERAAQLFDEVANDADQEAIIRDIAAVRSVTLQYDDLDPQTIIDRLGPLAQADNPLFGSAGELVAHAYIAQGKPDQAGPLLVSIAQNEDVPESLRARTRQLAGLLGFDAIEDVEETIAEITGERPGAINAPAAQPVE